jgi:voltage-gated potassium channel
MVPFFLVLIRFLRAFWTSLKDPEFQALFFLVIVTLATGAWFYRIAEGWSLLDSLYFSVITLTTIGYGDLTPSTAADKIFTVLYVFIGLGLILGFLNAKAARSTEGRRGILGRRQRSQRAEVHHHDDTSSDDEKRD